MRDSLGSVTSRLVYLDDEFDWTSGGKWLRQKVLNPLSQYGVTRDDLNRNFALIEYFPYHSKTFDVNLAQPLESQQYGFELVRQAIENQAIILLMRGKNLWLRDVPELAAYQETGNCITPHSKRNVILSKKNLGDEEFSRVIDAIKTP